MITTIWLHVCMAMSSSVSATTAVYYDICSPGTRLWSENRSANEQCFLFIAWRAHRFSEPSFVKEIAMPLFQILDHDSDHLITAEELEEAIMPARGNAEHGYALAINDRPTMEDAIVIQENIGGVADVLLASSMVGRSLMATAYP
eukprot:s4754_g4.t1